MSVNDNVNKFVLSDKEKRVVNFFGGKITISAGGRFKDDESGREIVYGPKVDLFKVAEKGCKVPPSLFLSMMDAVMADEKAMSILRDLVTKE